MRFEFDGDFRADFVATAANGGTDGGEQVCGFRAELHLHFSDGLCDDARESAAPSGMNGGDRAFFQIDQKDGDTIGGLDSKEQARAIRNGSVSAASFGGSGIEKVHNVGVELPERNESEAVRV